MPRNYLPGSDAGLLAWSANFAEKLAADPGAYGMTAAEAARYAAAQTAFAQAYRWAVAPSTRGPARTLAKNERRKELVAATRKWARMIMARSQVSDEQRVALGLNPRRVWRKRIPAPDHAPLVRVAAVDGGSVSLRLVNAVSPGRRGRPVDVARAAVFYHIGAQPPTGLGGWTFCRGTPQTKLTVSFPPRLDAGTCVWFTAFWENARFERGPLAEPTRAVLGSNPALPAVRLAA